jgi:hypothetical protein
MDVLPNSVEKGQTGQLGPKSIRTSLLTDEVVEPHG